MKRVTVTTAVELPSKQLDSITSKLKKKLGEPVELKTLVDPRVLGGISITIDSQHYDGTLSHRLDTITEALQAEITDRE